MSVDFHDHPFQSQARALARRLNAVLLIGGSLPWMGGWLASSASAIIILKLAAPAATAAIQGVAWAALGALALPLLVGIWLQRRGRFYTEPQVIEWIDHLQGGDGSVSAAYERPALLRDPALLAHIGQRLAARRPRLDAGFFARRSGPALLYFVAALLVPARPAIALQPGGQTLGQTLTAPLLERLAEQEPFLPESEARELREALEQVRENPAGVSREQWEAIEELEQRLNDAAARAGAGAAQMAGTLDQLAGNMGTTGNIEGTSATQQAGTSKPSEALLRELEQLANDGKTPLSEAMKKQARQLAQQMRRPPGDAAALRKQMEDLRKKLGECQNGCQGNGKDGKDGKDGNKPGRGGVSRGRADAELTFGEEQEAPGAQFKDHELQNQFLAPEDLVDMGVTPLAPQPPNPNAAPGGPAPRAFDQATGARASRTRIAPGQREIISRYFSQEDPQP